MEYANGSHNVKIVSKVSQLLCQKNPFFVLCFKYNYNELSQSPYCILLSFTWQYQVCVLFIQNQVNRVPKCSHTFHVRLKHLYLILHRHWIVTLPVCLHLNSSKNLSPLVFKLWSENVNYFKSSNTFWVFVYFLA